MYLTIIILPLLGSIISGFFGRKVGVKGSQLITCTLIIITTLLSIVAFLEVGLNNIPVYIHLFKWIDTESLIISWGFNFDSLTVSMLIPVLIVSSLVHVYSIGYMSHDPHNQRFFSYLSLFTFMMIILVTANNFLLMFVGWEGVGVCSYLLVSFWFTRIAANQSSISAFLTNRVGDCFLTVGMFVILWSFGNIDYSTVFMLSPYINENIITIIGICLLIGAMAKSSQIGLHIWLPMAMEGPTPVSALIHAATMVTAGVYLLMRTSPLIEYSSTVLIMCLWIGAITTVFSSLIGLFQQDIKKVIAYSTMSQLGMMIIAIGLSSYNIALFHLVNHAFYKGLLFLGAGAVIHAVADNQDFRKYGGLKQLLPLTYSVMLIASLSLVAFPFMTGFYSKDFILESAYGQFYFSSTVVYFIATIGAMFTTLYSVKVLYLTFLANPNGPLTNYKIAHEGDIFMSLPLIILAIFSVFFGYITKDIFIGLGSGFFSDNSLFIHPLHEIMLDTEFAVPSIFKLLPLFFTVTLSILALIICEYLPYGLITFKFTRLGYNIFSFFNLRFLIELIYNKYITGLVLKLGEHTTKILDRGSIELIGPYGLEKVLIGISKTLDNLNSGNIASYGLYILLSLIFFTSAYLFSYDNNLLVLVVIAIFNFVSYNVKTKAVKDKNIPMESSYYYNLAVIAEVLFVSLPVLLSVAYVTVAERKTMASMQRRLGPDSVGYYGSLQAFADALKLLLKEYVSPTQSNLTLFFLGPILTLIFSLLGYAVIPFGPGMALLNFDLGILYMLAVSSLATYGILLAGWSANSKYAFLGSLRSTAQLISYELILTSAILLVIFLTGSLNLTINIEAQRAVWFIFPLFPIFIIFFIGCIAETNRAPFDLAEAESELVSGFMTEHAAVIFVFFFLAEYASIVLICILTSILFLGGYLFDSNYLIYFIKYIDYDYYLYLIDNKYSSYMDNNYNPTIEGLKTGSILAFKSSVMIFIFIWVRASFPRIRFDQLMLYCWTILLPLVVAFIILIPCILYSFDIIPTNITLI